MTAKYWQRGDILDYTATETVIAGQVVTIGTRIGIVADNIPQGATGHVHMVGVFAMDKDSSAVAMGDALYYDSTAGAITTTASTGSGDDAVANPQAGYAVADASTTDTTVYVKLLS